MNPNKNQKMKFPIIFPHWRTGDRDSIFDYDFSIIKKINGNLLFLISVTEENGNGEQSNHYFYQQKLVLKRDFFSDYSKEEFLTILKILTDAKFEIQKNLKFNNEGLTTIWTKSLSKEELKGKEYFVSYTEERKRK